MSPMRGRDGDRRSRRGARAALDQPVEPTRSVIPAGVDSEAFGRVSERFARFMGTAQFLLWMSMFVVGWLAWNTLAPPSWQFDPRALNYTLLTLILSLQASYAAPLILLAQNRQADRDRVQGEQDRERSERALNDTDYLTREVVALRLAIGRLAERDELDEEIRDAVRDEVRALLREVRAEDARGLPTPQGADRS